MKEDGFTLHTPSMSSIVAGPPPSVSTTSDVWISGVPGCSLNSISRTVEASRRPESKTPQRIHVVMLTASLTWKISDPPKHKSQVTLTRAISNSNHPTNSQADSSLRSKTGKRKKPYLNQAWNNPTCEPLTNSCQ